MERRQFLAGAGVVAATRSLEATTVGMTPLAAPTTTFDALVIEQVPGCPGRFELCASREILAFKDFERIYNECRGVASVEVLNRYTAFIQVGKLFDEKATLSKVKSVILALWREMDGS